MSRLIIIEGLDGCGKSTLATRVMNQAHGPAAVLHAGAPRASTPWDEYVYPLVALRTYDIVICDRWHLGEMVWPRMFERASLSENVRKLHRLENSMTDLFDQIVPIYMYRNMRDAGEVRQFDYDVQIAAELYNDAIGASSLSWNITSLRDFDIEDIIELGES